MSPDSTLSAGRDNRLDEILLPYLKAKDNGEMLDQGELLARRRKLLAENPELAPELKKFFDDEDMFPPTGPRLPAPGSRFGNFDLLERIVGGMGVVYKARHLGLNKIVALKMIRERHLANAEVRRLFREEAEAAASLNHPNIVTIHDSGDCGGLLYFSMKWIDGQSLAKRVEWFKARPRSAARVLATVARAIHHAHQRGILHRDLKPANILLDESDTPYVADFGLAKRTEDVRATQSAAAGPDGSGTGHGTIVGTAAYMSPEQARGVRG